MILNDFTIKYIKNQEKKNLMKIFQTRKIFFSIFYHEIYKNQRKKNCLSSEFNESITENSEVS